MFLLYFWKQFIVNITWSYNVYHSAIFLLLWFIWDNLMYLTPETTIWKSTFLTYNSDHQAFYSIVIWNYYVHISCHESYFVPNIITELGFKQFLPYILFWPIGIHKMNYQTLKYAQMTQKFIHWSIVLIFCL